MVGDVTSKSRDQAVKTVLGEEIKTAMESPLFINSISFRPGVIGETVHLS